MSMEHHAYFYEGPMSVFRVYQEALEPFWAHAFEQFGVDDARELRALASLKHDEGSLFLVGAASITSEAQQALLKLFEEPQQGITFVLIVSHGVLLSTLKSRMLAYPEKIGTSGVPQVAKEFLSWPYKKRSDWITTFLSSLAGGEEGVRERVRDFVNSLEGEIYKQKTSKEIR